MMLFIFTDQQSGLDLGSSFPCENESSSEFCLNGESVTENTETQPSIVNDDQPNSIYFGNSTSSEPASASISANSGSVQELIKGIITPEKAIFFSTWKVTIFFLYLHKNICYLYSLEVPQWGTSNEYPQHFRAEIRKICGYILLSGIMDIPYFLKYSLIRVCTVCHFFTTFYRSTMVVSIQQCAALPAKFLSPGKYTTTSL